MFNNLLPQSVKIVEKFKIFICVSLAIILVGLGFVVFKGMNIGVDFAGGAKLEIETDTPIELDVVKAAIDKSIDGKYALSGSVQSSPSNGYVTYEATLKYPDYVLPNGTELTEDQTIAGFITESEFADKINSELSAQIATELGIETENVKAYTVGATASGALLRSAILALSVAIVVMLIYIVIRFTFASALAAVCALVHDVLIMIAFTAIFNITVNSTFIAAVITIVGYSINATIIIFDRIREERASDSNKGKSDAEVANVSIAATLGRTILTTLTTLVMVVALAVFSVPAIQEFIIPIIFGLLAGTFSSVFLASGFWTIFRKIGKDAKKNKYEGARSK